MKTTFSITVSSDLDQSPETERFLSALGMKRQKLVDYACGIEIVAAHNSKNGRRILDVTKSGFRSFRRAYGASLGWILGDYNTATATKVISANAGRALRAFFNQEGASGVIVLERRPGDFGVDLVAKEVHGDPKQSLDENSSLLLPTGITSPRLGGGELFERIDLAKSFDSRVPFAVREVLFTGKNGESIAGIGDTSSMFVERLHDILPALFRVLGDDYDLLKINSRMFSAIQLHELFDANSDEVIVPIADFGTSGVDVEIILSRTRSASWKVNIVIDGVCTPLKLVAPKARIAIDANDVRAAHRTLIATIRNLPSFDGLVCYGTIFSHLSRFPSEFQKEYLRSPLRARQRFLAAVNRSLQDFKKEPSHWRLIHFSGGRERDICFSGGVEVTTVQFCAPVYLTAEDERIGRASIYAVVELKADSPESKPECRVPSVLDHRMAIGDINHLRRGVMFNLSFAA